MATDLFDNHSFGYYILFQKCQAIVFRRTPGRGSVTESQEHVDGNKNRKPLAVLRLSSVEVGPDDVEMNQEPASKREDQVSFYVIYLCMLFFYIIRMYFYLF